MTATSCPVAQRRHSYHRNRVLQASGNSKLSHQQRRPISHFSCSGKGFPPPPNSISGNNLSSCQDKSMNYRHFQQCRQPQNQQRPQRPFPTTMNHHNRDTSVGSHPVSFSWLQSSRETSLPPAADELSSFSSNPNSLEASLYGSQYNHRQQDGDGSKRNKKLPHSYVLSPPSPSRQHVPKRPRFEGLNVVESFIQNLFSCGCVQGVAGNMQPGGFASKPFASRGSSNGLAPSQTSHSHGNVQRPHQPVLLNPPPKLRRMTLEEAGNDLDVTFMM